MRRALGRALFLVAIHPSTDAALTQPYPQKTCVRSLRAPTTRWAHRHSRAIAVNAMSWRYPTTEPTNHTRCLPARDACALQTPPLMDCRPPHVLLPAHTTRFKSDATL